MLQHLNENLIIFFRVIAKDKQHTIIRITVFIDLFIVIDKINNKTQP